MSSARENPRPGARWFRLRPRSQHALDAQLRDELESHIALAADYLVSRGIPRERAQHEARARFGDYDAAIERLIFSAREREARMRRRERFEDLRDDVRLAVRLFRRSPRFFGAAALTLAIGIGANGAVFSILRATLLQPLPYRNASELVMLWRSYPTALLPKDANAKALRHGPLNASNILDWRKEVSPDLGDVAALQTWQGNNEAQFDFRAGDRTERLNGAFVTPNFFDMLGVRAIRGRVFTTTDESAPTTPVVISHALWQRDFGGDPAIVGRAITLTTGRRDRGPRTFIVAGVLPAGVHFTYPEETEVWAMMPWSSVAAYPKGAVGFRAMVRLKPGVTLERAVQRSAQFTTGLLFPGQNAANRLTITVESMHEWVVGEIRPSVRLLGAVAAMLLLVTCVTVANGLLARVAERRQELAVRTALGAGRLRLVRQLLTEGAVLSLAGAAGGTLIAMALQPVLRHLLPVSVPRVGEISVNVPIIVFGAAMACIATLLAAVVPALSGAQHDASGGLNHAAGRTSAAAGTVRWRHGLVGAQAAIATVLLVSAALLLTSLWHLGRVPLGFDGTQVLTVEMRLMDLKYRDSLTLARFQEDLMAKVRAIPGITEAGLTSAVPFRGVDYMSAVRVSSSVTKAFNMRYVDPGYFGVLRVPLLRGRLFTAADRGDAPHVMLVSESYAKAFYGNEDPIGKRGEGDDAKEIVGVVGDVRYVGLDKDPLPALYLPLAQANNSLICVVARSRIGIAAVAPAIRQAIHDVDPAVPAMKMSTIDRIIDETVANRRFYTLATASFAAIALLLTIVGLAVVVARVVTERRRELAVRAALGATVNRLASAATRDVLIAVVAGIFVGGMSAYGGSVSLAEFLFQVEPRWPAAYAAVGAIVLAVAFAAAWLPVRRFQRWPLAVLLSE